MFSYLLRIFQTVLLFVVLTYNGFWLDCKGIGFKDRLPILIIAFVFTIRLGIISYLEIVVTEMLIKKYNLCLSCHLL